MFRLLLFCLFLSPLGVLGACATPPPTAQELAAADYGPKPDQEEAESQARSWILTRLKDPSSAIIGFGSLEKGWFRSGLGGDNRYAWRLGASVNARNSFGGYTGAKPWAFYFRGGRMVGIGEPQSTTYGNVYLRYMEPSGADGSADITSEDSITGDGASSEHQIEEGPPKQGSSQPTQSLGLTIEAFNAIAIGISYSEVISIIGSEGTLQSETVAGNMTIKTYQWRSPNGTSFIMCIFQDDALTNRMQFGL